VHDWLTQFAPTTWTRNAKKSCSQKMRAFGVALRNNRVDERLPWNVASPLNASCQEAA
jgi:hypothetical protein